MERIIAVIFFITLILIASIFCFYLVVFKNLFWANTCTMDLGLLRESVALGTVA